MTTTEPNRDHPMTDGTGNGAPRTRSDTAVSWIVGRNVQRLRRAKGLSGRALVSRVQANGHRMNPSSLSRIELGRNTKGGMRAVTVDELTWLAEALGVTPARLMDDSVCPVCHDTPPTGFICGNCGSGADGE
ncbi:helix-turn-helix domain-containing protein [Streptomyces antibioticus]